MARLPIVSRSLALVTIALLGVGSARNGSATDGYVALAERAVAMWNHAPAGVPSGAYGGEDGLMYWQADHPADDLFAFGHVLHVPGRPDVVDSAGPRVLASTYRTAFPDLILAADAPVVAGDRVTVRWRLRGTSLGAFAELAPTGQPYEETGSFVFRIAGDQIVETWVEADTAALLRRAGAVPASDPGVCLSPPHAWAPEPAPHAAPAELVGTPDPSRDDPYYTGA